MKVAFLNPPWWEYSEIGLRAGVRAGSRWPFTHQVRSVPDSPAPFEYLPYPFFLGYAASYCAKHTGADVTLRDSLATRESYQTFFKHLQEARYDVLVIESATPSWEHDSALIAEIHRLGLGAQVIVTGPIASAKADEILAMPNVVACVEGEYEKGIVKVLRGATGRIHHDLLTVQEMNDAPWPIIHANTALAYWDGCPVGQRSPQLQVWSSRGCPYRCIFCVWPATMTGNDPDGTNPRRVRYYSPDYMREFLTAHVRRDGYRSIYLDDDTFNLSDRHVLGMCEVLGEIGLPWSAMCRADTVRRETWQAMRDSGCFGVKIGVESGSQHVLDHIVNKRLDLETVREAVHFLKSIGMTVHGTFTVGLPGETREQVQDTLDFIASLPFDSHQLSGTAEIEGTPLATLSQRGHLDAYDGATLAGYDRSTDGQKKIEGMAKG